MVSCAALNCRGIALTTTEFFDQLADYLTARRLPYQRRESTLTLAWRAPLLLGLGSVSHDYAFYDLDRLTTPVTDRAAVVRDLHARHRQAINARFSTPRPFRLHIPDIVTIAVAAEFDRACREVALEPAYSMLGGEAHLLILLALHSGTITTRGLSPRYELHPVRARDFVRQIARDLVTPAVF